MKVLAQLSGIVLDVANAAGGGFSLRVHEATEPPSPAEPVPATRNFLSIRTRRTRSRSWIFVLGTVGNDGSPVEVDYQRRWRPVRPAQVVVVESAVWFVELPFVPARIRLRTGDGHVEATGANRWLWQPSD